MCDGRPRRFHLECVIRMIIGSVAHQSKRCSCHGGVGDTEEGLSVREAAKRAYLFFVANGARN